MKKNILQIFMVLITSCFPFFVFANSVSLSHISQDEFEQLVLQDDVVVIDVRTVKEYQRGYIPGAINIPHKDIIQAKTSLSEFSDKKIVFYCHSGVRVGHVTDYLQNNPSLEFQDLYHLKGDFRAWRARGKLIETP